MAGCGGAMTVCVSWLAAGSAARTERRAQTAKRTIQREQRGAKLGSKLGGDRRRRYGIVEGESPLWGGVSEPYKHTARSPASVECPRPARRMAPLSLRV